MNANILIAISISVFLASLILLVIKCVYLSGIHNYYDKEFGNFGFIILGLSVGLIIAVLSLGQAYMSQSRC